MMSELPQPPNPTVCGPTSAVRWGLQVFSVNSPASCRDMIVLLFCLFIGCFWAAEKQMHIMYYFVWKKQTLLVISGCRNFRTIQRDVCCVHTFLPVQLLSVSFVQHLYLFATSQLCLYPVRPRSCPLFLFHSGSLLFKVVHIKINTRLGLVACHLRSSLLPQEFCWTFLEIVFNHLFWN